MWLVFLILSLLVSFAGLTMLIGGGWAFVILDLIFNSLPSGHPRTNAEMQKMLKPLNGVGGKLVGLATLALGFYLFYLAGTTV